MWLVSFQLLPWFWIPEGLWIPVNNVLSPCRPCKWSLPKIWQFLLLIHSPLVFTAGSYGYLPSWHWNPELCSLAWAGISHSQSIPPNFYLPHVKMGPLVSSLLPLCLTWSLCTSPPVSTSLPLLSIWMNVASLNLWLWDFHTVWFSVSSGCYLFWGPVVIPSVVVWRGEVCLPMPPSWPEVSLFLFFFSISPIFMNHSSPISVGIIFCHFEYLFSSITVMLSTWFL